MEFAVLSRRQRQFSRQERHLRFLEREHIKNIREIKGTLEAAKKRLEKRRDWLKELEEILLEEEAALKALKAEFLDLLDQTVYETVKARSYLQEQLQETQYELDRLEEHTALVEEEAPPAAEDPPQAKVLVQPLGEDETEAPAEEAPVLVQWYHPQPTGF